MVLGFCFGASRSFRLREGFTDIRRDGLIVAGRSGIADDIVDIETLKT
jgi:hypothetical protein